MILIILAVASVLAGAPTRAQTPVSAVDIAVKDSALKVLNEKCNICHRRQNPRKVFTDANMDKLAPDIYKQVFVKKRMPRGNTISLTEADQKALTDWLRTKISTP
jgi:uncharacterized membrane protein